MAKPVSISFTFQTQSGPIPLSELDTNFASVAASINDFATYGNYLIDTSGAANVITVTTPASTTFSYNAGVPIQVQIAHTTTISGVTINVNGLGSKAVVNNDGSVLIVGAFVAGQILEMMYDGTSFRVLPQPGSNTTSSFAQLTVGPPAAGTALTVVGVAGANTISANGFVVAQTGAVSIAAPSAGSVGLTVTGVAASNAVQINVPGTTGTGLLIAGTSGASAASALFAVQQNGFSNGFTVGSNGTNMLYGFNSGNVTIGAPVSGSGLTVNGAAGAYAAIVETTGIAAGSSFGLFVAAGTNASDISLLVRSQAGTNYFYVAGDGGAVVGAPTGGDKGSGSFNAVSIYDNGTNIVQTGTFTGTLTGCTTSPTATFNYTIVNGTHVIIDCSAGLTGTSNTVNMTVTGVPAALTPARAQITSGPIENNTAFQEGYSQISGTTITFGAGNAAFSGGFTNAGTKGVGAGWNMAYNLV
jgi:hypothetical protein